MAKLRMASPQLRTLGPAVRMAKASAAGGSWQRENAEDRAFLKTAEWQRMRWQVLRRDAFTCQWPGCGVVLAHDTKRLVADHIVPVRVAPERKWDMANLQCLCDICHSGPTQAAEVAASGIGSGGRGQG